MVIAVREPSFLKEGVIMEVYLPFEGAKLLVKLERPLRLPPWSNPEEIHEPCRN